MSDGACVAAEAVVKKGSESTKASSPNALDEDKFKVAKEIAEQIWREQQLTAMRLTWNLTFQGFLVAIFAVTFKDTDGGDIYPLIVRFIVCIGGFFVAFHTRASIIASQKQRDYLKLAWDRLYNGTESLAYPRPFADRAQSLAGRRGPDRIIFSIVLLWVAFFALNAVSFFVVQKH